MRDLPVSAAVLYNYLGEYSLFASEASWINSSNIEGGEEKEEEKEEEKGEERRGRKEKMH